MIKCLGDKWLFHSFTLERGVLLGSIQYLTAVTWLPSSGSYSTFHLMGKQTFIMTHFPILKKITKYK